ncbi:hypothetical protein NIE79_002050 [Micromonospora sp. NIE79]|uniref:Uncharacterized protein n=1 Tax=Micromonospora trifolii TaxID=2911208 RepID=A0ABS9N1W2_9ACTN|nr:hypothetical protein [Micromonospora trifolii]MCG5443906.1 hypothetical protein [Micromonospora trifolii]
MIGTVLAWCFLLLFSAYTAAAIASFAPPVDRWMRRQRLGAATLRSVLPFWGLFAQRFGMFDLDLSYRRLRGPLDGARAHPEPEAWLPLTDNRWRWWCWLWRPGQRADQASQILAYRLISGGAAANRDMRGDPAYQRITAVVRRTTSRQTAAGHEMSPSGDYVVFRLALSRGYWTTVPTQTIFVSAPEPAGVGRPARPGLEARHGR